MIIFRLFNHQGGQNTPKNDYIIWTQPPTSYDDTPQMDITPYYSYHMLQKYFSVRCPQQKRPLQDCRRLRDPDWRVPLAGEALLMLTWPLL